MAYEIVVDCATGEELHRTIPDLVPPVPEAVDMAQARLALLGVGITSATVDAQIALMPSPHKEAAQIEWEFRPTVRRSSSLVQSLGTALGLSEEAIDDLFRAAVRL